MTSRADEFSVELVDIADLVPHPENYRDHPPEQVAEIREGIERVGYWKNVVAAEDGRIVAGHGVIEGAVEAGETQVPVVRVANDVADYVLLADNELTRMAVDDEELRARHLRRLHETAGTLRGTGWDEEELAAHEAVLKAGAEEPVDDPGAGEPPEDPQAKLGDVWLCGEHRVVCGDCTEAGGWEAAQCEGAALGLTDPPYNVGYEYEGYDDDRGADEYEAFCRDWFEMLQAHTARQIVTPGSANEGMWFGIASIYHVAPWTKTNAMTNGKVSRFMCAEPILFIGEKWPRGRANDVFNYPVSNQRGVGNHTCPKPLGLFVDFCENYSERGEAVVDCFLGSGTTLIAAEQLGRVCYGIELEPRYVDVALRRWAQATGQVPTLESDGTEFEVTDDGGPTETDT